LLPSSLKGKIERTVYNRRRRKLAYKNLGRKRPRFLNHGIPSHDTFSDVLNRVKPKEFSEAFTKWVSQLGNLKGDIVSVDGKTMRRTLDRASGASAMHLVSAWSAKNNFCFSVKR